VSGIRGIAKNLTSLFSSHAVAVLQQVALVPLYIHAYGKAGYGEWLALSAAVSYLGTLDFGVQTFVTQDLTVRYHRGEMEAFHVIQSTAVRLLLGIVVCAALASTVVFFLPLQHLLNMDGPHGDPVIAPSGVQMAVFFLALQAITGILFGYFGGSFMVFEKAYMGGVWANVKALLQMGTAAVAVLLHATFANIAMATFAANVACILGVMLHVRRMKPEIFPTLRFWDGALVPQILGQSGYFALLYLTTFMVYQLPILLLQREAGGAIVTLFSVMRTIFSMTRNMLNALSQALGPEVTKLYAMHDWVGLGKLYEYSERLIFALIPVTNLSVLVLCPFLLTIWLHQGGLFVPGVYLISAATSIVTSTREHKFQFQFSTNMHKEVARFWFATYLIAAILWALLIPHFGLKAVLWVWFSVDLIQLLHLVWLNSKLFAGERELDKKYLLRLALISSASLGAASVFLPHTRLLPLAAQVGLAVVTGAVLLGIAIPVYDLAPVWGLFQGRLKRRFA
jgi:O-antigen/teichoic acid export membrane protein